MEGSERTILDEQTLPVLKQICNGMPGGFFIYKSEGDGEIVYINDAMLRIFGCKSEEEFRWLTDYKFKGIVHPDDYDRVQESIEEQIAENPYSLDYVEYRIIRADGSVRWVEDYGHFLPDSEYGPVFYVFIEDATERMRKRMEDLERVNNELNETLAREFQYQRAILSNATTFFEVNLSKDVFISSAADANGDDELVLENLKTPRFTKYTEFVESWTGSMSEEDEAAEFRSFFDRKRLMECYEKDDLEQIFEHYMNDSSGRKRLYQFVFLIGRNKHTEDIIALLISKDINDESEKQRLYHQALIEANAGFIARQTFLNNISHDIRTPLNSIIGYTHLIDNNINDSEKIEGFLDKIRVSANQLLEIVRNSLELSNYESGKAVLHNSECIIEDVVKRAVKAVRPEAEAKNLIIESDVSKIKDPVVYADGERLCDILYQLLDNSVKYTSEGGFVRLTVKEERDSALLGYGKYIFVVEDNGCGISREFIGEMFDPFKREHNTTISGVHGSGLGLSVVKNNVDLMQGTITAESEINRGSTITVSITFPLERENRAEDGESAKTDLSAAKGLYMLLVDDNEVNLEIEREILKEFGCIVDTASNGEEAVEKVRNCGENPYKVVLMDIQMPVMDGHEAAKKIRALSDERTANIPIIAVSANTFDSDREKSFESGMNGHFPKPVDMQVLLEFIVNNLHL